MCRRCKGDKMPPMPCPKIGGENCLPPQTQSRGVFRQHRVPANAILLLRLANVDRRPIDLPLVVLDLGQCKPSSIEV